MCKSIEVTGDKKYGTLGTYIVSNIKSSKAPDKPTYKLKGKDRCIYYYPDNYGWIIGEQEDFNKKTEGEWYYKSKYQ